MTAGVTHYFQGSIGTTPYEEVYRSFSGGDGRYELVDGKRRTKWNNYTMFAYRHYREPGHEYGSSVTNNYADASCVRDLDMSGDARSHSKLFSKLTEQVRNHQFNMGIAVGEGAKTLDLVANTAYRIATAIRQVRRGDLLSARRTLTSSDRQRSGLDRKTRRSIDPDNALAAWLELNDTLTSNDRQYSGFNRKTYRSMNSHDVASAWLELQYGWIPLLSDVYEAGQAFARLANGPRRSRVTVKSEFSKPYIGTCGDQVSAGGQRWAEFTRRRMIVYEMTEDLSAPRQMGLLDPLSVAWELTPYSFVADWFLPIGDYLDNLAIIPNLKGRFLMMVKSQWRSSFNGAKYPGTHYYIDCAAKYQQTDFSRTVLTSPPSVPLPGFKPMRKALSSLHVANAVALIKSALHER